MLVINTICKVAEQRVKYRQSEYRGHTFNHCVYDLQSTSSRRMKLDSLISLKGFSDISTFLFYTFYTLFLKLGHSVQFFLIVPS